MNKFLIGFLFLFFNFTALFAESFVQANKNLIWDSNKKTYTANGSVIFQNATFTAYSDRMVAQYITENDEELFTIIELFENVKIELDDETFLGQYAIYTRDDNIIKLIGDVSVESPSRILTGDELIADIDNNKRILNSSNKDSLVEVLLDNNAKN